jgi:hypothetical protein
MIIKKEKNGHYICSTCVTGTYVLHMLWTFPHPKGKSRMYNPKTQATLGTRHRKKKTSQKKTPTEKQKDEQH